MAQTKCPRCEGNLSREPVISHIDNATLICAACGTEETFEVLRGELTHKNEWPVERQTTS